MAPTSHSDTPERTAEHGDTQISQDMSLCDGSCNREWILSGGAMAMMTMMTMTMIMRELHRAIQGPNHFELHLEMIPCLLPALSAILWPVPKQ
jgi:hypothetical protein